MLRSFIKQYKYILGALAVLLVFLSPNIFFSNKARHLIHDNLNSNVVWYKNLAESGKMFAGNNEEITKSLHNIPRGCYPSEFNIQHLLYCMFDAQTAYNVNAVLMHILAFFSMFVFARKYIFKYTNELFVVLISLAFALLPFWPSGGGAISMQPLLLYAFLNILNKEKGAKNWLVLFLVPMYSVFVFSNMFFVIIFSTLYLVYAFRSKQLNFKLIAALGFFSIVSLLVEYRLFYMQFIAHFQSHRDVLSDLGSINIKGVVGVSLLHFLKGHYHFISGQTPFILLLFLLAFVSSAEKKEKRNLILVIGLILTISVVFVLPNWTFVSNIMAKYKILNVINLRFYSLFPLLWFIVLTYSVALLIRKNKIFRILSATIVIAICGCLFLSVGVKDYYGSNYAENTFYNTFINQNSEGFANFRTYYKTSLFEELKKYIDPSDGYIACLGFDPEVAQYNGFSTIDGYFYYYSKAYNQTIYAIDKKERKKTGDLKKENHCILVCNDIKVGKKVIDNLELDFDKMKSIGTRYLFSIREIKNDRLESKGRFSAKESKGSVFVYQIN